MLQPAASTVCVITASCPVTMTAAVRLMLSRTKPVGVQVAAEADAAEHRATSSARSWGAYRFTCPPEGLKAATAQVPCSAVRSMVHLLRAGGLVVRPAD